MEIKGHTAREVLAAKRKYDDDNYQEALTKIEPILVKRVEEAISEMFDNHLTENSVSLGYIITQDLNEARTVANTRALIHLSDEAVKTLKAKGFIARTLNNTLEIFVKVD